MIISVDEIFLRVKMYFQKCVNKNYPSIYTYMYVLCYQRYNPPTFPDKTMRNFKFKFWVAFVITRMQIIKPGAYLYIIDNAEMVVLQINDF